MEAGHGGVLRRRFLLPPLLILLCAPLFGDERPQIYTQAAPKSEPGRAARIAPGSTSIRWIQSTRASSAPSFAEQTEDGDAPDKRSPPSGDTIGAVRGAVVLLPRWAHMSAHTDGAGMLFWAAWREGR